MACHYNNDSHEQLHVVKFNIGIKYVFYTLTVQSLEGVNENRGRRPMILTAPRIRANVNYALKTMFDHSLWKMRPKSQTLKVMECTLFLPPAQPWESILFWCGSCRRKGSYLSALYLLKGYMGFNQTCR